MTVQKGSDRPRVQNNEHIRYEPGEHSPPAVTLGVALQGIILILANSIPIVTIVAIAADDEVVYLAWAVTAAVTVSAIMTALQSARIWRIGAGHMLLVGPGAPFRRRLHTHCARSRPCHDGHPDRYICHCSHSDGRVAP